MDPLFFGHSARINLDDLPIDSHAFSPNPDRYPSPTDGFFLDDPFLDLKSSDTTFLSNKVDPVYDLPSKSVDLDIGDLIFPSTSVSSGGGPFGPSMSSSSVQSPGGDSLSPSGDADSSDPVLKYISQMLMEENMEEQPWVFADQVALQNAEKSLAHIATFLEVAVVMEATMLPSVTASSGDSADANILYPIEEHSHAGQESSDLDFQSNVDSSSQLLSNSSSSITNCDDGSEESLHELLLKSIFSDGESMIQFKKGLEEASKFLPTDNQLGINPEDSKPSSETKKGAPRMRINEEINMMRSSDGFKGLKNHERDEDALEEGRANKQTALYTEESELSDLFDEVLLCNENGGGMCSGNKSMETGLSKDIQPHRNKRSSNRGRGRGKKQESGNIVDLRTLLILCAQAISTSDFRTANELLKQIRENSSPSGDGSQRLAHYFANGLEARLVGDKTRTQDFYSAVVARTSAADVLKAYHLHISTCPFIKFSIFFANCMILKLAEKATTLHIIDFGIAFGFQWPILIQKLSSQSEGPCKLRITGIELPQAGFRPGTKNRGDGLSFEEVFKERLVLEREFYGREIMNVVACEGSERVERPETYKQWQARHMRAGFKALPLGQELTKLFRSKMKEWYHKDFVLDEDGNWMLQGLISRRSCFSLDSFVVYCGRHLLAGKTQPIIVIICSSSKRDPQLTGRFADRKYTKWNAKVEIIRALLIVSDPNLPARSLFDVVESKLRTIKLVYFAEDSELHSNHSSADSLV
ncbi:hypothetical protein NL676_032746 [Syzygium grande]|nr:hypothetical protein NL676_032746 [Syzygium grande]